MVEHYGKSSDGLEVNGQGNGSSQMTEGSSSRDAINPQVLEQALKTLETKKTAWYAYLTTKDFWIVLVIG